MLTVLAPEVLDDPIGVLVEQIAACEPGLDSGLARRVVEQVAGGRAKRRRLAQAVTDRPGVLTDGRSPAPRAVGDLLTGLRKAGAARISPPICAGCGKPLRTFQRRGQDWYCAGCGTHREPCVVCGQTRPVHLRDQRGRPRCAGCQPEDGPDPLEIVTAVVTGVEAALTAETVRQAAIAAAPRAGQRHHLAWALQERPDLLTGAGADAPVPTVLRLINQLAAAGATTIVQPGCPGCGRVIALHRPINGTWLCRNCVAKSRAQPCARCGAVREPAARDPQGQPVCANCLSVDADNQEICAGCGRRRPVATRTPGGPLCPSCLPVKVMTCAICGRHAPCHLSHATGQPWCSACRQRRARCSNCGQDRPVRGGTLAKPLCATCTRGDPGFWQDCPRCGEPGRVHVRDCARCHLHDRLRDLFADADGVIRPDLQTLHQALASAQRPATVAAWLGKSTAPAILADLRTGDRPLTHQVLDELPPGKTVQHLRAVLVNLAVLPPRDEHLAQLQRWITTVLTARTDPGERELLHRYATWHVVRRLRGRLGGAHATHEQVVAARRNIAAAIALLDWLTRHRLTLAAAGQGDLDVWVAEAATPSHRTDAGNFVRWARRHKLTRLDYGAVRWDGPTGVTDAETRWEQARRLLHDDALDTDDRVAGLLVLLYAQTAATISRLTLDHVQADHDKVRLRLGREPIVLPEPLAELVLALTATRHGHAAIGDQGTSPWLFPGGRPGRPISSYRLTERLRNIGIYSGQARSTALFQLATELPAAVLARMLGIHITVAVAWQRACAGDWTAYAADVSRRPPRQPARGTDAFGQF
jgi:hypothetical protein